MKFQVTRAFSITRNGRRVDYKLGQRIGEAAYNRLTKTQQGRFLPARNAAAKTPYTRQEISELVNLYLSNSNLHFVRDTFVANNPNSGHSVDSVYQTAAQLRTMDVQYPGDTEWAVKSLVAEVAIGIDSDRFSSDLFDQRLDALLADIRA